MSASSVLVIGGGIAGIQASLDLANAGAHVYLVEKAPFLGGRMAQLFKTFPTNDCSTCIEAPLIVEAHRHPNIDVLVDSEVMTVAGNAGNFKVKVLKKPKYVNDNCTSCGDCFDACPEVIPNEFDVGLKLRKAIYLPFPQAVPSTYTIDRDLCLNKGHLIACEKCLEACEVENCIDFEMAAEMLDLDVVSIIVACGGSVLDPRSLKNYGYGKFDNVITNMEFERLVSASGPTEGELIELDGMGSPNRITFVLCAGSRDVNFQGYCSRVCCMNSIKEALLAKEHLKDVEITLLYMDIRSFGKGFEEYYNRAKEMGIKFVRGKAADVTKEKDHLVVRVENTEEGKIENMETDMVVLTPPMLPAEHIGDLAKVLDIKLDDNGFFRSEQVNVLPLRGTKEGIFLCGVATGPKDIADSVAEASGAASGALSYAENREHPVVDIPEKGGEGEPRIGVFVCHCGNNIAGVVDVEDVAGYAGELPNVVHSENTLFACADVTIEDIINTIREKDLNRIIVAACSPKTHGDLFMDALIEAGINPYLFEMSNIRNQCSWVHADEPQRATEKSKTLIRMSVARANLAEPLMAETSSVTKSALIVGGGIAGLTAALDLNAQGIDITLIEKAEELGGRLKELHKLSPEGIEASKLLTQKMKDLLKSNVNVMTAATLEKVKGYVGNFQATIKSLEGETTKDFGAIILAIGADLYEPTEFGYEDHENVITNLELEKMMEAGPIEGKTVSFIQCVGARNEEYPGCSRYCCEVATHQVAQLAEKNKVNFLYKDMRTFGKGAEENYKTASEKGVRFFRWTEQPEFDGAEVKVQDVFSGMTLALPTDLLVLSVAMRPNQETVEKLVELLKVPLSEEGFLMEKHVKLGPVESSIAGVYLAGCAAGPKRLDESVSSASGAAAKAAALLSKDEILVSPIVAFVREDNCRWCARCSEVCPYSAIDIVEIEGGKVAWVNGAMCTGCGACVVECPTKAMILKGFKDEQIEAQIDAMMGELA
jgi:heterodisulfide reductase subunit A